MFGSACLCVCVGSFGERERAGRKDEWEGFSFHLHKECRIKGMRQVLPPNWRSARSPVRNNHCQRDFSPRPPPPPPLLPSLRLLLPSFLLRWRLGETVGGTELFWNCRQRCGDCVLEGERQNGSRVFKLRSSTAPTRLSIKNARGGRGSQTQQTAAVPRTQLS